MSKKTTATPLPATLEEAIAQLTELTEQNAQAAAEAKKKDNVIEQLNAKITKLETAQKSGHITPTIEVGGKEYNVNSGTRLGGNIYSAQEISEDAELAQSILDIEGQTILTPVAETEEGE
jgi:hypothetical protein